MRHLLLSFFIFTACTTSETVEFIQNPTGNNSSLPRLYTDNSGSVFMSWVEQVGDSTSLFYSRFEGESWSSPSLIATSSSWFVNWADFPSVISQNGEPVAAHWLKKIPGGTYAYNVEVKSFSQSQPIVPHSDGTATEHGFVSMVPMSDSSFYAIWLDGRNMAGGHGHEGSHGSLDNAMTLRGAEISSNHSILQEHLIDEAVCECCNTSLVNTNNGVVAAYRNRTSEEIRDIYVSKLVDGNWTEGIPVFSDDWYIGGCPVNGPALSSFGNSVVLGWFTGVNDEPKVKLAFSADAAESFSNPILIEAGDALGRVDVTMLDEEYAWISWISRTEESALLKLIHADNDGILEEITITEIDPSRRTGFPQLTKFENQLLMAWTDISGESPVIQTAIIR